MASSLALARAGLALDGFDMALADGQVAYELEPHGGIWRASAALDIGLALVMRDEPDEAVPFFVEVDRIGDSTMRVYALAELAPSRLHGGKAHRAAATAVDLVAEIGIGDLIMAVVAHAAQALTELARGDERAARVALRRLFWPPGRSARSCSCPATPSRRISGGCTGSCLRPPERRRR